MEGGERLQGCERSEGTTISVSARGYPLFPVILSLAPPYSRAFSSCDDPPVVSLRWPSIGLKH